eukprot:203770-Chlamydomonas_euryale.AAC.1
MISRVTEHTSFECTCLANGRPSARRWNAGRCSGSSRLQLSAYDCGVFSTERPACKATRGQDGGWTEQ